MRRGVDEGAFAIGVGLLHFHEPAERIVAIRGDVPQRIGHAGTVADFVVGVLVGGSGKRTVAVGVGKPDHADAVELIVVVVREMMLRVFDDGEIPHSVVVVIGFWAGEFTAGVRVLLGDRL